MNQFFVYVKAVYICAGFFLAFTLVPALVVNVQNRDWTNLVVIFVVMIIGTPIAIFIFKYYRNVVILVTFKENDVEITTNKQIYHVQPKDIKKIEYQLGKIYIYYGQSEPLKKFIYQTIYTTFKEDMPDIQEWKKNLPHTQFINFY
jgi:hypothetical protein